MKSPAEIGRNLARQWQRSSVRLERLLNPGSWPQTLNIGKPSARLFTDNIQAVLRHVENWRRVSAGKIDWEPVSYRAGLAPISLPMRWHLRSPSEWIAATNDPAVSQEFARLEYLVEHVDSTFHALLVAQRSLWLTRPPEEVVATAQLATRLSPGCAQGRPLRLLAEHGVDTKFFERNASLLTRLLDERFEGAASEQGLTTFLDAFEESAHWVLVVANYLEHCSAISRQLIGYLPQDEVGNRWSRGFFLWTSPSGLRRAEITPSKIYEQMALLPGYTTHRTNAYRKFIRTTLAERGCPPESLAAYMGHWLRGEEPQDVYSSFCPAAYANVLDEWISPLLRELGWSALSSQWVNE